MHRVGPGTSQSQIAMVMALVQMPASHLLDSRGTLKWAACVVQMLINLSCNPILRSVRRAPRSMVNQTNTTMRKMITKIAQRITVPIRPTRLNK